MKSFSDYPDQVEAKKNDDLVLLPAWNEGQWALLADYTEMVGFETGDVVIRAGDTDRSIFIIVEGELEILIPQGSGGQLKRTETAEAGGVIGEQAFIDGKPRSATVRALTSCKLLHLRLKSFNELAAHHPDLARDILFGLAHVLSIKLRHANLYISKWIK